MALDWPRSTDFAEPSPRPDRMKKGASSEAPQFNGAWRVLRSPRKADVRRSEATHDPDDDPLDRDVVLVDVHRRHRLVRRLETNASVPLAVELLHRRRIAVQHGDDHLAVVRALAFVDDDEVT